MEGRAFVGGVVVFLRGFLLWVWPTPPPPPRVNIITLNVLVSVEDFKGLPLTFVGFQAESCTVTLFIG